MTMPGPGRRLRTGAGGAPAVVFPSVNMTMTLSLLELGSKRAMALEKASAWLVLPPAERESTAFFKVDTEVISWGVLLGRVGKADDADAAARADQAVRRAADTAGAEQRVEDTAALEVLLGPGLHISPTRFEKYQYCPFGYFCSTF